MKLEDVPPSLNLLPKLLARCSTPGAVSNDATRRETLQRINRLNDGKSFKCNSGSKPTSSKPNLIGKESSSSTVSSTGVQRVPDKRRTAKTS
nr:MAG TPA: hypothetical protein [Caudoviricetes sp.]